jgi:hypothetical protein
MDPAGTVILLGIDAKQWNHFSIPKRYECVMKIRPQNQLFLREAWAPTSPTSSSTKNIQHNNLLEGNTTSTICRPKVGHIPDPFFEKKARSFSRAGFAFFNQAGWEPKTKRNYYLVDS